MIDIIQNNPFRILGVYADASAAEIKRNETKIRRYLEVGKAASFSTDEMGHLPYPDRNGQSLDKAFSSINLPKEKLYYALFWYTKDDICHFSECLEYLVSNQPGYALIKYLQELNDYENCVSFQKAILNNVMFEQSEVIGICLDGLFTIERSSDMLFLCETYLQPQDYQVAKKKLIEVPLNSINSCVISAKNADKSTPSQCLQAGRILMESTKHPLTELRSLLDKDDQDYKNIVDSVAKQILQCGINYYNETNDEDKIAKALELQEYALSIAEGKLTRERCQQNVDILMKKKRETPPALVKEEHAKIEQELRAFTSNPDEIEYAWELLKNTKKSLRFIRRKLTKDNAYYIRISTLIAENALHNVIAEVNEALKQLDDDVIEKKVRKLFPKNMDSEYDFGIFNPIETYREQLRKEAALHAKSILERAWDVIMLIDVMHLGSDFINQRYQSNRDALEKLCKQASIKTAKGTFESEHQLLYIVLSAVIVEIAWIIGIEINCSNFWDGFIINIVLWVIFPFNVFVTWGLSALMSFIEKSIKVIDQRI